MITFAVTFAVASRKFEVKLVWINYHLLGSIVHESFNCEHPVYLIEAHALTSISEFQTSKLKNLVDFIILKC